MPPKVSVLLRYFEHFQNIIEKHVSFLTFYAVAECQLRFGVPADSHNFSGQSEHAFRVDETHFVVGLGFLRGRQPLRAGQPFADVDFTRCFC